MEPAAQITTGWTLGRVARGAVRYGPSALIDALAVFAIYMLAAGVRTGGRLDQPGPVETASLALFAGWVQVMANIAFKVYWRDWSVAALEDLVALVKACAVAFLTVFLVDTLTEPRVIPYAALFSGASVVLFAEAALKLRPRWGEMFNVAFARDRQAGEPTIIVGAGRTGQLLARDLQRHAVADHSIIAFVDDDPRRRGQHIRGIRVAGSVTELRSMIERYEATLVVIALARPPSSLIRSVMQQCEGTDARVRAVSGLSLDGSDMRGLREIGIEELLGRDALDLDTPASRAFLQGKKVLITGAAGSIGSELARQVARFGPSRLILLDVNESGLFDLRASLALATLRPEISLTDLRDPVAARREITRVAPDVVFHAAAYKHVGILEHAAPQGVLTNLIATRDLLQLCVDLNVPHFVLVSTDKAVQPVSVMGRTKRLCEVLTLAVAREHGLPYCVVRFGNVLGSSGSVVPIFERQIQLGGPVTVTHPDASRFFMTIPEAAGLVIQAAAIARSADLLVLDMGTPISIMDLARKMIRLRGLRTPQDVRIEVIGLQPAEKVHEELAAPDERLSGSEHPSILRVTSQEEHSTLQQLEPIVAALEALARDGDSERLSAALEMAVDTKTAWKIIAGRVRLASPSATAG